MRKLHDHFCDQELGWLSIFLTTDDLVIHCLEEIGPEYGLVGVVTS